MTLEQSLRFLGGRDILKVIVKQVLHCSVWRRARHLSKMTHDGEQPRPRSRKLMRRFCGVGRGRARAGRLVDTGDAGRRQYNASCGDSP